MAARKIVPKKSYEPKSLRVPKTNIVDLSDFRDDQEEPITATTPSPEIPKASPGVKDQKSEMPKAQPIRRTSEQSITDRLERWWWQVDTRGMIVFTVLVLIVGGLLGGTAFWGRLSNAQGIVLGASTEAYEYLRQAQGAIDTFSLNEAAEAFHKAEIAFTAAESELKNLPGWLFSIIKLVPGPGQTVASGEHLVKAGRYVAQAGEALTIVMQQFNEDQETVETEEGRIKLVPLLEALNMDLDRAISAARGASAELAEVEVASLPSQYQNQVRAIKDKLPAVTKELDSVTNVVELLQGVLGSKNTKEYLLLFQNTNEARATGGFIGSLAQVAVKEGTVNIVEVPGRGAYEINEDFDLEIIPPRPLSLVNNAWQLQDANWWPDYPTSAAKIIWFYETARGFPIHGVISFTQNILVELLDITGPVDMTERYGEVVTSENFLTLAQNIDYNVQENAPKALIADLMPKILDRLLNISPTELLDTLAVINQALLEKHMLMYFTDTHAESLVRDLGWGGEIRPAPFDYLSVVHTNISGGKTDLVMQTEVDHQAEIQPDGTIRDTVTIVRRHHGDPNNELTKIRNVDYIRIYVPKGAKLVETYGFSEINNNLFKEPSVTALTDDDLELHEGKINVHEDSGTLIYDQFDKTVFANWLTTEAGATSLATITYTLPSLMDNERPYSILIQKQSGTLNDGVTSSLSWPDDYSLSSFAPVDSLQVFATSLKYQSVLSIDRAWGAVLKKTE